MKDLKKLTPENWAALTDDEKTEELRRLLPGVDYAEMRKEYERKFASDPILTPELPCPVLELELIDPVMTYMIIGWLYATGNKLDQIPVFGYRLKTLHSSMDNIKSYNEDQRKNLRKYLTDMIEYLDTFEDNPDKREWKINVSGDVCG